jgi:hypothetical protein
MHEGKPWLTGEYVWVKNTKNSMKGPVDKAVVDYVPELEVITETEKSSSAGTLNLDDIGSLNRTALDEAIQHAQSDIREILETSKLAAEISEQGPPGTVVFNDEPLSGMQQAILKSILGKDTDSLKALQEATNCTIRLKSEFDSSDITGELIMVSEQTVAGYEGTKHLLYDPVAKIDQSYIPAVALIAMAKGLLGLQDNTQKQLIAQLKQLSYAINNRPLEDNIIDQYINNGIFEIQLPAPAMFDYEKLETFQRQALAALIAA